MAEQADGSIIIDTEVDAEGFRAGSAELQRAIKSLNTKMDSLGPTFQKAISGNASAVETFNAKATTLEKTISDIEAKMESLEKARVPTEDYQWLTDEIRKAEQELSKLYEKEDKMEATGVKQNSRAWQSLQYDIDLAKRKIAEYKSEQSQMEASGTAFQMGADTAQYAQLESSLASAKSKLAQMRSEVDNAGKSSNRLVSIAKGIGRAFSTVGKVGITTFKGLKAGIQTGISKLKSLSKTASGGCTQAIGKLGKKITGLGSMIKRMLTRKLIMAMFTGIKEGVNNLAQYSSQTNASLSTLKSGLTQLKNSLATAFAPILTVITPALATLINYLSTAITYIGKFIAALTGAKTFTKATAVQEDYAESLGSTGAAAEKAQKQLAGFDELNVLSDSSSSGGGGASGVSPSEMFEEVPIESNITDFVDRLKAAFKAGDYAEIGRIIGNGINTALQKINNFISWDNVGDTVTKVVSGIAEGFNSLIYTVDWELLGDTVAQGLNTVLNTLYLIITKFDWPAVAAALARSLNGLISGFDWGKLGTTISTGFITALKSIRSAITTFNWAGLGSGVAEGINKIDWVGAFKQAAGALSDAVKGLLDLCIGFAEKLDWGKLGSDLWKSIVAVVTEIDWGGIVSKAFRLLGNAIGGAAKLLVEFAKSFWESLKSAWESTKSYFTKYIEEAGGNVIQGLWNGIVDAIKGVGNWIVEHIWNPFIEGFKNAFGIHSPSTKMAEMGGYVIEGLWNGIKGAWNSITEFFSNALSKLGELISGAWDGIKNAASTAWNGIKGVISGAWDGIKTGISNAYNAVKTGVSNAWNSIKSTASSAWSGIKGVISGAWDGIKSGVSNAYNTVKTGISNAWNSVKSTASTAWNGIKGVVSNAWDGIKTNVSSAYNTVKTGISNAWNSVKSTASTAWTNVKTTITNAWSGIKTNTSNAYNAVKTGMSNAWNSVKSTASTAWTNVKTTVSNAWNNIKTNTSSAYNTLKSNISGAWNSIKSTASSAWNGVKSTLSNAWNGIKSNTTSAYNTLKSNISGAWNNIKSTASTAWNNIKSTIQNKGWSGVGDNICSGIKSGIDSGWSWLKNTVGNLATSLLDKAKSALGIHSPSRLFRDIVGLNIGYGIGEGIEASEDSVVDTVTGLADAIAAEANAGEYDIAGIVSTAEVDGALTGFSDKIADSFTSLLDRLQAIAEGVTFSVPAMAGSVIPYTVAASANNGSQNGVTEAITASNDELSSVIIQSVTNATTAIVGAIQEYSGTTVNLDSNSLTTSIIKEINRRTRMNGKSPLTGV